MKIILNVDAITHPLTGIGQYTLNLGQALQNNQQIDDIKFFSSDHWVKDIDLSANENKWLALARRYVPFKSLAIQYYAKHRAKTFSQLTHNLSDYIFHSPNFVLMPFEGKSVATFHDLSFVHYRETQPAYRLKFLDQEIPKTLQQADALLTPTEFVKQEIINHYGYPAEQIQVTPLGVDNGFQAYTEQQCVNTLHQHGLKFKTYILSVATIEPRKNLSRLLQAYSLLPESLRAFYPLVLVGSNGWLNQKLNSEIKVMVNQGQIISLGFVNTQQLQHLYAAAKLTAFPSLYEGFGLPIIESMASGTPVLTSDNSAMQEVAGGHAMLCDPLDVNSIYEGLFNILENQNWYAQAQTNGSEHANNYSWKRCADYTLTAYHYDEDTKTPHINTQV